MVPDNITRNVSMPPDMYAKWHAAFADATVKAIQTPDVLVKITTPDSKLGWPEPFVDAMLKTLQLTGKFDLAATTKNMREGNLLFELNNGSGIELIG